MPMIELNKMLHAFYFMEGKDVRKPEEKADRLGKFNRIMALFGKR